MDRRTFLATVAIAVGAAGCTPGPDHVVDPTTPPVEDPDADVRASVIASEQLLIATHTAALATHPQLAEHLAGIIAHHREHVARLGTGAAAADPPLPTAPTDPSPPATAPDGASTRRVLRDLAGEERRAHAHRAAACDAATDPGLARDLALVAASESQHAAALRMLVDAQVGRR